MLLHKEYFSPGCLFKLTEGMVGCVSPPNHDLKTPFINVTTLERQQDVQPNPQQTFISSL